MIEPLARWIRARPVEAFTALVALQAVWWYWPWVVRLVVGVVAAIYVGGRVAAKLSYCSPHDEQKDWDLCHDPWWPRRRLQRLVERITR